MTLIPPPRADVLLKKRQQRLRKTGLAATVMVTGVGAAGVAGFLALVMLLETPKGNVNDTAGLQHMSLTEPSASAAPAQAERSSSLQHASATPIADTPAPSEPSASTEPAHVATQSASPVATPTNATVADRCPSGDFSGSRFDHKCATAPVANPAPAPSPSRVLINPPGDICPAGDYSPSRLDGDCGTPPLRAELRLAQATSSAPGKYYCTMWWDGRGTGIITSDNQSASHSGEQTGTGATFSGPPGSLQTCTFTLNGKVVATKSVMVNTQ